MKLFVGGLNFATDNDGLRRAFETFGELEDVAVISDRDTGRSRGFGFVEMDVDDVASVITATNGREIDGRPLRVNEAEDKGGSRRDSRGPRDRY